MEHERRDEFPAGLRRDPEVPGSRVGPTGRPSVTVAVILGAAEHAPVACLESVRGQTAAALDLIVVDAGADERIVAASRGWMTAHGARFRRRELIGLSPVQGAGAARNLAFRRARSDAVLVLLADDFLYPRCVEALAAALDRCEAGLAYCTIEAADGPAGLLNWRPGDPEGPRSAGPIEPLALVRKSAWERAGGYPESPRSAGREHVEFHARLGGSADRGILVPEVLARQPIRPVPAEVPEPQAPTGRIARAARILADEGPAALLRRTSTRVSRGIATRVGIPRATPGVPAADDLRTDPARIDARPSKTPVADPAGCDPRPARRRRDAGSGRMRLAVLSSALGNYYFREIRDLIASGLVELGHEAVTGTEDDGFRDGMDRHIIVAPHEFFLLGRGAELLDSDWPDDVIIVSTEQPSTRWFSMACECLPRAGAVWDIEYTTSRLLRKRGIACDYLPLGYAPGFSDYGRVDVLPLHDGTAFLGEEVRRSPSALGPLRDRPIDLLFVGGHTPRREAFFARAAPALAGRRAYLHLSDSGRPRLAGRTTFMDTPTAIGLSQRSRILLNVHHGSDVYFEWHRIVLHGLWQRTLVVSEPCSLAPPFRPGIDYVEAELDRIPRVVDYYLDDPRGQVEAQGIADSGHRRLIAECRLSHDLRTLLDGDVSRGAVLARFEGNRPPSGPFDVRSA